MDRRLRGQAAEDLALAYLTLCGLRLLERHFRVGKAEVDLVMQEEECVVFVEVKYRGIGSAGRGSESIAAAQRVRIGHAASAWLAWRGLSDLRFDAVVLDEEGDGLRLRHVRGAFDASGRSG